MIQMQFFYDILNKKETELKEKKKQIRETKKKVLQTQYKVQKMKQLLKDTEEENIELESIMALLA